MRTVIGKFANGSRLQNLLLSLGLLLGLACGLRGDAQAQVSTMNVLKRTAAAVALEEQRDEQVLFIQVDHVSRNNQRKQTYPLDGNARYRIYAIGDDDRITDIDLSVLNDRNLLVKRDNDAENIAIVDFAVQQAGNYTFQVNPYRMRSGARDGFFSLILVRLE